MDEVPTVTGVVLGQPPGGTRILMSLQLKGKRKARLFFLEEETALRMWKRLSEHFEDYL